MFIKSQINLVYVGQTVRENGSPMSVEIVKTVRCDEMELFSRNYYSEQERNMRWSHNIVIPTYLTEDIVEQGVTYELLFCVYAEKKYRIRNILKMRNTRQRIILDIEEVR